MTTIGESTATIREATGSYRQGTRAVVPEGKGQKIRVRLMGWAPGSTVVEGSSADYPVEVIARDFAEAFPIGTRMRANHDGFCEAGGDIRRIMAKTTSTPTRESDGMYADALVREGEPTDFIRQYADVIGTSISAGAEVEMEAARDEDGEIIMDGGKPVMVPKRSERGAQIVKRFLAMSESPYNSVDFVEAPGADGAIVSLALESAKQIVEHMTIRESVGFAIGLAGERQKNSEATPSRSNKEENSMDPKDIAAIAEAVAPKLVEALRPSTPESEKPNFGESAEAVIAAGLTEAGRKAVYERVDRGEALESAIDAEKTREANYQADVEKAAEALVAKRESSAPFGGGFGYTDDTFGSPLGTESKDSKSTVGESLDNLVEI